MEITDQLPLIMPAAMQGTVARMVGMTVSAEGFPAPVGAVAEIQRQSGPPLLAEVIGFRDDLTILYPFSNLEGVRHGNRVRLQRTVRWLRVGNELLGRVIDAHGTAVEPSGAFDHQTRAALESFQRAHGLAPTGRLTTQTVRALGIDSCDVVAHPEFEDRDHTSLTSYYAE
jgi:flagellar biosynthesis/type III secretory pathway ATPase